MANLTGPGSAGIFFEIVDLTADMALAGGTFDHANTTPRMINAPVGGNSLEIQFKWTQSGFLTVAPQPIDYRLQVNLEEEGKSGATSLDANFDTVKAYAANDPGQPTREYDEKIAINLGTAAGELAPGVYTVTALFYTENTSTGTKVISGFTELGKVNVY